MQKDRKNYQPIPNQPESQDPPATQGTQWVSVMMLNCHAKNGAKR